MASQANEAKDSIIQALYAAAAGLVPWGAPLEALHRSIGMYVLQLVVVDKDTGRLVASEQPVDGLSQESVDGLFEHIREYHRVDPHMSYVATLPIGKVMHSAEIFPRERYDDHPFYREFWSAFNARSLLAAKVAEDERYIAMLGMVRSFTEPPYSENDIRTLEIYVGHLAAAFRITQRLRKLRGAATAGAALMEASNRPMVLLDANAQIVTANSTARDFLGSGQTLHDQNGKLRCRDMPTERRLWNTLAKMGREDDSTTESKTENKRVALRIPNGEMPAILCSIWPLHAESSIGIFGVRPIALLTVALQNLRSDEPLDPVFLGALFDLTPAEVRVATALVQGRDLKDVAKAQRISIETIRSQLKSIYGKTDTHRQAQLVELLLRATAL
ncbi:MAG: helix-turn-helix transcriptional regulator [Terriglobia bacterium]